MLWIVDEYILSVSERKDDLISAIKSSGADLVITKFQRFKHPQIPEKYKDVKIPCLVYGSIQFVNSYNIFGGLYPASYYCRDRFLMSNYLSTLNKSEYINEDGFFVPYGVLRNNRERYISYIGSRVFVRPNTGIKLFTGCLLDLTDINEIDTLEKTSGIVDNTLVWVSTPKSIEAEYRFVVVDGQVITGSMYHKNDQINISSYVDPRALKLAEKVALGFDDNHNTCVCDIAIVDGEAKIVELNAVNTSGWYECDVEKIVYSLNEKVRKDFEDIYS